MIEPVIIGDAKLYFGDCVDVLKQLSSIDCVITDPPYSETTHSNAKSNRNGGSGKKAINFNSMTIDELNEVIELCGEVCERWFVSTMEWRHIAYFEKTPPAGYEFVRFGIWLKTNPMPQISADRPAQGWEGIAYMHSVKNKKVWNGGGKAGNYVGSIVTDGNHPTGKPLPLFNQFVDQFTSHGEIVLDPFMGSGTTGVSAVTMGRKFIGIERDRSYFDIACERIERAQQQQRLFA